MSLEDNSEYVKKDRRDFKGHRLGKEDVADDPMTMFNRWLRDAIDSEMLDPYTMTISTIGPDGYPRNRFVYLRGVVEEGFIFYTNYNSDKGEEIDKNSKVALTFYWEKQSRQVRITGDCEKLAEELSDDYFNSRPRISQLGAWASEQSRELESREELEARLEEFKKKYEGQDVPRPPHWGGYLIRPNRFEFWQGREGRLHDRVSYEPEGDNWTTKRLSP